MSFTAERWDRNRQSQLVIGKELWRDAMAAEGVLPLASGAKVGVKADLVRSARATEDGPHNLLGAAFDWQQNTVASSELTLGLADDRVRMKTMQANSAWDSSDEDRTDRQGLAFLQRLDADLVRTDDWLVSSFVRYSQVDDDFDSDGLSREWPDRKERNWRVLSVGGTAGWGPLALTLSYDQRQRLDTAGYREELYPAVLQIDIDDLRGRLNLGDDSHWWMLLPDSAWVSVTSGRADTGSGRHSEDRISEQGLGLSWNWQGSYASFEVWRYLYDSHEAAAEEADWVGHGGSFSLGAYGRRWNVDASFGLDYGDNQEASSASEDNDYYGTLAVSYRPEKLPDVVLGLTLGRSSTEYFAYDGESSTDYHAFSAELDLSKYLRDPYQTEGPRLSLLYWTRNMTYADTFGEDSDEREHVIGLVFWNRW